MKKVIFLTFFSLTLLTISFAFRSPKINDSGKPKITIVVNKDETRSVQVTCPGAGSPGYNCNCGSDCGPCRAGAHAWIAAGGCGA